MDNDTLVIVWTSGDIEVAQNMVFMYTLNAKKNQWWKNIKFIIWGLSSKLLSESKQLQEQIKEFINHDITVEACKACADRYDVSEYLASLGVEVKYMGEALTDYLKSNNKVITF
ncbi:MAG: DsrE family protein [Halanaerobiales bacterium]|nr:DsrE family protein [Halanaerobiales bacterium]